MGTIGAPPACKSLRLSVDLATMTCVSQTWHCNRVPALIVTMLLTMSNLSGHVL